MDLDQFKQAMTKRIIEAQQRGYREELYQFYCVMQNIKQAGQLLDHVHASAELLLETIGESVIPLLTDTFTQADLNDHGLIVNPEDESIDFEEMDSSRVIFVLFSHNARLVELEVPNRFRVAICSYSMDFVMIESANATLLGITRAETNGSGHYTAKDCSLMKSRKNATVNIQDYAGCIAEGTTSVYARNHSTAKLRDQAYFVGTDCSRAICVSDEVSVCLFGFSSLCTDSQPRRLALHDNAIIFQDREAPILLPELNNVTMLKHLLPTDTKAIKRFMTQTVNPVTARCLLLKLEDQKKIAMSIANGIESPKLSNWLRERVKESTSEEQMAAGFCSVYTELFAQGLHPDYLRYLFKETTLVSNGFYMFDHGYVPQFMSQVEYHVFGNTAAYQPFGSEARGHFYEDSVGVIDSSTCFFHQNSIGIGRGNATLFGDGKTVLFGTYNNRVEACGQAVVHGYYNTLVNAREQVLAVLKDNARAAAWGKSAVYMIGKETEAETFESAIAYTENKDKVITHGLYMPQKCEDIEQSIPYKEVITRKREMRPRPSMRAFFANATDAQVEEPKEEPRNNRGVRM